MRPLLLAVLLPALVGCSKVEMVYRNADWLIERWADQLLDLTPAQKAQWRSDLDLMLTRHRQVELPQVVALLGEFEQHAREELPEPVLTCLVTRVDELLRRHAHLAVDLAVPLLARLSEEQITHLEQSLEQRSSEYRQEYLVEDPEERIANRTERVLQRIERWTGSLQAHQREMVALTSREMPDLAGSWLQYRRDQQHRLLTLLRNGAGPGTLRGFLEDWWVDLAGRPPLLVVATDAVVRDTIALLSRLDRTLGPDQRQELVARISQLRAGLEAVVGGAVEPGRLCSGAGPPYHPRARAAIGGQDGPHPVDGDAYPGAAGVPYTNRN